MARPKSILKRVEVDVAQRAHNCQHSKNHRLERGDSRLKVWKERTAEHYCAACAMKIIERDIAALESLAKQLQNKGE